MWRPMVMTMGMLTFVSAVVLAQPAIPSLEPYPLPSKARQALVDLAGKSDILILGETHGTQEVPAIAVALLEPLAKQGYRALALEIPSDQQAALRDWATGKTDTIPSFFAEPEPDGRGNVQVLSLIRIALSPPFGWRLICFDQDEADEATEAEDETAAWIQRDAKMAANLMAERSRLAFGSKVLAICGNAHARTSNTNLEQKNPYKQVEDAFGKLWPSFAARLCSDLAGRQVRSINVVRSERKLDEAEAQPLDKQWYDWELNLPRATPAAFLTPKNPVAIQAAERDVRLVWFPRYSPDGKWLATARGHWDANEGGEVRVWDAQTGEPKFLIPTQRGVRTVAWAPKGAFFVSGDYDGMICFYDAETGERTDEIKLPRNVEVLQFLPDEERLVAAIGDGSVHVFGLPLKKPLHTWNELHRKVWGMAISPDGETLCTCGRDRVAYLLDMDNYEVLHHLQHPADVNGVVFSEDGKHVLTGCGDAVIRVFEVESGKEVGRLEGHQQGSVTDLCFAPGGKLLASCGMDGSVRLWDFADFANPKLMETLDGANDLVFGVAISPDGKRLAFGGWSDRIRVIDLDTHEAKWSWQPEGQAKGKGPDPDPAALRQELLDRMEKDQFVRRAAMKQKPSDVELRKMEQVDRENRDWLKKVIDERGWPGKALVGEDGAHAAWLLVQHADPDLAFQKKCLGLLTAAVKNDDASAQDMAYLVDRIRVAEKKPQVYGTQLDLLEGALKPKPIEDEEQVDARRKEVGLPPLSEYLKFAEAAFSQAKEEP